ncbi:MAG: DUF454 domain-containing protein [Rhodospirillaceae bacterium]|nr:DUF454 domain-containing protein [Rhodospirillaceae bacterium]MYB15181.1 DUF454 domain-containing protein [Rhodospirillaceae bacterium]MYI49555.1 DUF454 domain-containing protein [Rhodospirillaceae bacterium]
MDRKTGRSGLDPRRAVWFAIGFVALLLAALGAVLPLLPTTVFLLVAAFAFARSSDRWHAWLLSHRVFGPLIADWRDHRAIDRRAKILSAASMAAVFGISLALGAGTLVLAVQAVVLGAAAAFVLSRPSPPPR